MSFGTTTYFYDRNNYKGCQQLQLWDNKILVINRSAEVYIKRTKFESNTLLQ